MIMRTVNCRLVLAAFAALGCGASPDLEPAAPEGAANGELAISQSMAAQRGGASSSNIFTPLTTGTFSFTYNSSQNRVVAIANTPDGGYVTGGTATVTGSGSEAWVMKFDAEGNRVWERRYGTTADDSLTALIAASNGDIVFTGSAREGSLEGSHDIWLVRLSSSGEIIWQKAYGGINQTLNKGGHEQAKAVIETGDGNIAIVGDTLSFSKSGAQYDVAGAAFFLEVAGSSGAIMQSEALVWSRYYNDAGRRNTSASSIVQTADGGFAIAGTSDRNFWALKMSRDGVPVWMNHYDYTAFNYLHSLVQDIDGQIVLAGSACNSTGSDCDVWTVKADQGTGAILWAKKFDGAAYGKEVKIRKANSGFVLAGTYAPTGTSTSTNMLLTMLDSAGNLGASYPGTWQKNYGGIGSSDAALRPGGGFLFTGLRGLFTGTGSAPFFIGTDPEGAVTCPAFVSMDVSSVEGVLVRSVCPLPPTGESCCTDAACGQPLNPPYDSCQAHESCVARVCIPKPADWVRGHVLTARDTLAVSNTMSGTKATCQ
jgi:hypothetical protein